MLNAYDYVTSHGSPTIRTASASISKLVTNQLGARYTTVYHFIDHPFPGTSDVMDFKDEEQPVEIPITDVFDLHTVPPRDAEAIVEAYLDEAHARGFRYVRIIHGRGIGAQREMVRKV